MAEMSATTFFVTSCHMPVLVFDAVTAHGKGIMTDLPPALLDAIAFAARAHRSQTRKDGETPYVSHVFRVCLIARHLFGVTDPDAL